MYCRGTKKKRADRRKCLSVFLHKILQFAYDIANIEWEARICAEYAGYKF